MWKRCLLSLLAATSYSYGNLATAGDLTTYIVNGTDTSLTEHPDFASLFFDSIEFDGLYGGPFCGATVLSNTFIMTAAHCIFDGTEPNEYYMLFTTIGQVDDVSDFPNSVETVRASKFYYYSSFSGSDSDLWADDIAIIELEASLNVLGTVTTPTDESYRDSSNSFVTIGLGKTSDSDSTSDNTLLAADMTYVSNASCQVSLGSSYSDSFSDNQICFQGNTVIDSITAGVCSGDSGGPIYYEDSGNYTQVGITSFGPTECGSTTITSYYTEVADYTDWIDSVMNGTYDDTITTVYEATDAKRIAYLESDSDSDSGTGSSSFLSASTTSAGAIHQFGLFLLVVIFGWRQRSIKIG
jgi:secreted trypsin-like serine protease